MTFPEPELVAAARDGDAHALDAVLTGSMPLVYNLAGRALHGHADVDDVVQETMLRVVRGIRELQHPESYRSWLVAITLRQARDQGRKRSTAESRTATASDAGCEFADLGSDFAGVAILRLGLTEQRRGVAEATRWLDPEDRELLSLWWLEESGHLDRSELAHALGVSTTHAAVRVHRLKRRLDATRGIVEALRDAGRCSSLRYVAEDWDGTPNPLWRKRFDRHIRDCDICAPRERALVPVARLLRGMPLVPVPFALQAPVGSGGAGMAGRGRVGHRPRLRPRPHSLFRSPPVMIAGVGVAAAAAAAYAILPSGHPASTPLADVTRPAVVTTSASPSPTTASPTPPRTTAAPSKSASSAPADTKAAAVASTAAQTSTRKGVGVWTFNGEDTALAESGASWYYTWSAGDEGISAPKVGFVPMIWGSSSVTSATLAQAKSDTSCGCMLGFNEPDMSAQSNLTPSQALSLWPQLESTGLELGSPAVAAGGATAGGWLDQFMSGAHKDGYRVNFITLHWYGSDFDTNAAVSQLQSYIEAVYARYHVPIWLTEFALISWATGTAAYPTEAQQAAFLTAATSMLDSLSYVQRYAWFGLPATSGLPSTGLFQPGPVVTPVGTAFEAAR
ncbi:sigma-70 family RNA polymerase sigma factor [Actinospica sp. MGRD01-02]|uniref:Sigma-70 family RNA polymerase sigma factor n=1 Tax=Actinospica acidithermotolerans TaxID=2828514 RepID=A0A941EB91_9ACTN|nr:sigma-70 family RNA polymerase sigma factor [Actinospica acidithermotolerans]MBR7828376.1 sigma-70 family RNA polymerase sigma factor [Actinospica acidithermotolerans]